MTFTLEHPPLRSLSEIRAAEQSCGLRCRHGIRNENRCDACANESHLDNPAASFRDEDK